MTICLYKSIISKLGGDIDSNPEILTAFPPLLESEDSSNELLSLCLPIGSKENAIIKTKYKKNTLLSYIFSLEKSEHRHDLFSFSILIEKFIDSEIYQPIIENLIYSLKENDLLTEEILQNYQNEIYESLNEEKDLKIEGISIELSALFKELRKDKLKALTIFDKGGVPLSSTSSGDVLKGGLFFAILQFCKESFNTELTQLKMEGFTIIFKRSKNLIGSVVIEDSKDPKQMEEAEEGLTELLNYLENLCTELNEGYIDEEKIKYLVEQYSTNLIS